MILSGSISFKLSGRIVAVFLGCLSFCTAKWYESYSRSLNSPPHSSLTVLVHSHVETLLEPAGLTLVPVGLVNDAGPVARLAPVDQPPPDGPLEEA